MFYNILGAFAQFYREQLAENVASACIRPRVRASG
jgi:DNA invertase Pin-like site-specific DNA recombinase